MESNMRLSLVLPVGAAQHGHDYDDLIPLEKAATAYLSGSKTDRGPTRRHSTETPAKDGTPSTASARTPSSQRRRNSLVYKITSGASLQNVALLPPEEGYDEAVHMPRRSGSPLRAARRNNG
eukprot:2751257-Rhodomonas_salina.4